MHVNLIISCLLPRNYRADYDMLEMNIHWIGRETRVQYKERPGSAFTLVIIAVIIIKMALFQEDQD